MMPTHGTDEVLTEVTQGVGRIRLNRPAAINALTLGMIEALLAALTDWAGDARVERVELTGAGERGLCAGADVRVLREQVLTGSGDPMRFFATEYRLNALVDGYPKPYRALMSGIVMGGGLGLSAHGSQRVVECPAWCIELESHSEAVPDLPPGARARTHRVLDSFTIDYGRCLFCGICIEECPFDALAWSEVAEPTASGRHDLVRPLTGARRSGATARPSRLVEGLVSPD